MSIFETQTDGLIHALGIDKSSTSQAFDILELGAGDGSKTLHLLRRLVWLKIDFEYHPGDISQHFLDHLEKKLKVELPSLTVKKHQGEYFQIMSKFNEMKESKSRRNDGAHIVRNTIVLFLGSTIGNMSNKVSAFWAAIFFLNLTILNFY